MLRRTRVTKAVVLPALAVLFVLMLGGTAARASSPDVSPAHGLDPFVLLSIAVMLLIAKLGGELFAKLDQPAVLGELMGGIIVGALALFGVGWVEQLRTDAVVAALAEIGVIILLFEVGLESNVGEMMSVGWSSLLVALLGVVAPFLLGWGVAALFLPNEPALTHLFIGATLCATSVGITARVLRDIGKLQTREASIILGAAVIDDVLGLLVLAVIAGVIRAASAGEALALASVGIIALKSIAFLVGALLIGQYVVPRISRGAARLEGRGVLVAFAVSFCFLLAWAAAKLGLAPIVGAFAAGLVLDEVHFESFAERGERTLTELLAPVSALLVPVFFVLMGLKVDLRAFARTEVIGFAAALTLVAIIGKQACSLGVVARGVSRTAVGLGMIPRGEVGLIFAGIGATLILPTADGAGRPVVDAGVFGAVVIMVVVTTLVTPPALKWSMKQVRSQNAER
ncbi:MAG TPA: cation:proton antiporter [Pyrinomonadaceae bacterium]|nr:cation:proton antiporter [Pyrinomonadaceae bacterium]